MTRTEQIKLVRQAGRYIRIAEGCVDTSFATLVIGVPLTVIAFAGFSVWPGVIFWCISWSTKALGDYYTAAARELHQAINESRTE